MHGLEVVIKALLGEKIVADVWIDGSFMTEKINPEDSDIVVCVNSDVSDRGSPTQLNVLLWISSNLRSSHLCDSYVHVNYPTGDPLYWDGEWMKAYWIRQFGVSRGEENKGMAVIEVR